MKDGRGVRRFLVLPLSLVHAFSRRGFSAAAAVGAGFFEEFFLLRETRPDLVWKSSSSSAQKTSTVCNDRLGGNGSAKRVGKLVFSFILLD